jgi:hypothetical protein
MLRQLAGSGLSEEELAALIEATMEQAGVEEAREASKGRREQGGGKTGYSRVGWQANMHALKPSFSLQCSTQCSTLG